MRDKTAAYLDEVCSHIRERSVHNAVRDELLGHIEELAESYAAGGLPPAEAEDAAVLAMGSAEDTGLRLNKLHRPKTEWSLIFLTAALAALGLVINRSATTVPQRLVVVGLGAAALLVPMFLDYTRLKKLSLPLYIGLGAVLFLCSPVLGLNIPTVGKVQLQISITFLSQLFFPLFAGAALSLRTDGGAKDALKLTGLIFWVLAALAAGGRLSYITASVIAFTVILACMAGKGFFAKKRLALIPAGGMALVCSLLLLDGGTYITNRLRVFVSGGRWRPTAEGYLAYNLNGVLRSSHLVGSADSEALGVVKNFSELTLASIVGSLGYLAGLAIVATVAALLIRLFLASSKTKGAYGGALGLCCCAILLAKFAVGIFTNFSLLPFMGVTFPLLGQGGTDYVLTMLLIGLVLSVYRRKDLCPE